MTKASNQPSRPVPDKRLQKMREELDANLKAVVSSCEKVSTEKALQSAVAVANVKMLPYLEVESEHICAFLDQERGKWKDWIAFFEGDCVALLDSAVGTEQRIEVVKALAKNLRGRSEAEGRWGRTTRNRLLNDLDRSLARALELCPYLEVTLDKIGGLASIARATLEQAVATNLGQLEEVTALYWVAFTLFIERHACTRYFPRFESVGLNMSRVDANIRFGKVRSALVERCFMLKDCRDAQAPLRLASKQLQRYLRAHANSEEALELMVSIYRILGRTDALYKAEMDLKRAKSVALSSPIDQSRPPAQLDGTGISFEIKCKRLLDAMGFDTQVTEVTADGGIDIIATRSDPIASGRYIVQCKDWQNKVGVKIVRELYGVVIAEDANKGILITSSEFTSSAVAFAEGKRLELIDGQALERLLSRYLKERL